MLSLRPATPEDSDRYLAWRNDPAVVAHSLTRSSVDPETHRVWFQRALRRPTTALLVVEHSEPSADTSGDATPAGQVRFEIEDGVATIHYSLARRFRGRRLAAPAVAAALRWLLDATEATSVRAEVRSDNPASCRVFEKLGFRLTDPGPDPDVVHYELALSRLPDDA